MGMILCKDYKAMIFSRVKGEMISSLVDKVMIPYSEGREMIY
jgi:hypothetical protein